jgi:hypothetical protein
MPSAAATAALTLGFFDDEPRERPSPSRFRAAAEATLAEADDLETYGRRTFGANDNAGAR